MYIMELTYFNILIIVLAFLTITEFLFARHPKAQNQIYHIAFAFTVVWVSIKYLIGPDISSYYPLYLEIKSPIAVLQGDYNHKFEIGYILLCSILKLANISYWGMTLITALLYFSAIYQIFKEIPQNKTFALLILAVFEYNLMLYQCRQSLGITAIIFAYLAYRHRRYIISALLVAIAIAMHKSVIMIVVVAAVGMIILRSPIRRTSYILLFITFLLLVAIPLRQLLLSIISTLHLPPIVSISVQHHILQHDIKQVVLPIYLMAIALMAYYYNYKEKITTEHIICWLCFAVIAVLFQQWFLLSRLRSLFIPFIIPFVFKTISNSHQTNQLPKQLFTLIFIAYTAWITIGSAINNKKLVSKTNRIVTVFDLIGNDKQAVINEQLHQAHLFWEHDYDGMRQ